ncbi:MAG: phenylalanine--tRNA ligase subunit beta [Deltaproteobacteria bacterium]|nr:phenylalanine--tRNA ligase subunit beta [Deltaproteobacteria bacterium]
MLVPLNWLRELVAYDVSDQELAELLTMAGLEVDALIERHQGLDQVFTARVTAVNPHPNADKLKLVEVDLGTDERPVVVCGAPNVTLGMVAPLAREGAVLGGMTVKKAKIRGVESRGMLCSARELEFSDDHSGLLALPADTPLGVPLVEALGLTTRVLEISITPNRGDCLSILGVAREVAALRRLPLNLPPSTPPEEGPAADTEASVVLDDPAGCPRYAARLVRGVSLAPSPWSIKDRLAACGVRPINNVVDVTNYLLLELGQPLHSFDFALVAKGQIRVRAAAEGELFTTLDGVERRLSAGMLLICDGEKPVALAGVMGGLNSEIVDTTQDVLIESAFFDPLITRRTSKRLGLSTEASYRFERATDISGCALAADRAALLLHEWAGGKVAPGIIDAYPAPAPLRRLSLSVPRTAAFLGLEVAKDEVTDILTRLGLTVEDTADPTVIEAEVPAHRTDLERSVDLTEEVARVAGYNRIPAHAPVVRASTRRRPRHQTLREEVKDLMAAQGFDEAINYSFDHPASNQWLRLAEGDPRLARVALQNPLAEDQSVLRTSLLPGLLGTVRRNLAHRVASVAVFELGKVFWARPGQDLPQEPTCLAGALAGLAEDANWWNGERPVSLALVKGAVEYLGEALRLPLGFAAPDQTPPYLVPGECCRVLAGEQVLGELGLVRPEVAAEFEIKRPVYIFDLDYDRLVELTTDRAVFQHLPRFPEIERDLAMVVDQAVPAGEVLDLARDKAPKWLVDLRLFDVYRGKPLSKSEKSLGLRFTYRDPERTLAEEEVQPRHEALVAKILEAFQGRIRN